MSFGETIKKLRKERKLTQDQLANMLNVTPQAISRWENNSAMPDISLLVPLAHVFHVSTDELLGVNVEEMESQIHDIITKAVDFSDPGEDYVGTDSKIEMLRDAVRKFPESISLRRMLIGYLTGKQMHDAPYQDPAILREQASLYEEMLEIGGSPELLVEVKTNLVSLYKDLGLTERISEIVKDAPEMKFSKEMLNPKMLEGRNRIDARKELIYKCTNAIILNICAMRHEDAAELTEEEWSELDGAFHVVETIYGKDFADHFILISELYNCVQGSIHCGRTDEAVVQLADIVRRLELMETTGSAKPALLSDEKYESLCLLSIAETVTNKAKEILICLDRDWDVEKMKQSNALFADVYQRLKRVAESDEDAFNDYCRNTFLEYTLKRGSGAKQ